MKTAIQKSFAPFKTLLPAFVWRPIRALGTAVLTPFIFSRGSGHFRSSLREKAVSRSGEPLPWYTYPCINLLTHREFADRRVLEFGGGQSTVWWASKARQVLTLESDADWHAQLARDIPSNVELHLISGASKESCLADVERILAPWGSSKFDVVVVDADFREDLVEVGLRYLSPGGALICDDAESYGFFDTTRNWDVQRVDFFGHAPGVVLPRCTSVFFRDKCFLFDAKYSIPDLALEL